MLTWKELEKEFAILKAELQSSRIDAQWGDSGEHWHIAGGFNQSSIKRFEELARIAGEKMMQIKQTEILTKEPDPIIRWYKGIQHLVEDFEYSLIGEMKDNNGRTVGYIHTGSINHIAESSAILCLKLLRLAAEEENNQLVDGTDIKLKSTLIALWDKYMTNIIIGVVATVIAAIILSLIL